MDRLPGSSADRIYDVLTRYAEASPSYYDRELFCHLFGVLEYGTDRYQLNCIDDKSRFFVREDGVFKYIGHKEKMINSVIKSIINEEITRIKNETNRTNKQGRKLFNDIL